MRNVARDELKAAIANIDRNRMTYKQAQDVLEKTVVVSRQQVRLGTGFVMIFIVAAGVTVVLMIGASMNWIAALFLIGGFLAHSVRKLIAWQDHLAENEWLLEDVRLRRLKTEFSHRAR